MQWKRIAVRFYRTERGSEPVREWLRSLNKTDRVLIGTDVRKVEYGWPIGMPTCRAMGQWLYEVRTTLPGNRIARLLFCVANSEMTLLHGFMKKSQKTPKSDLAVAIDRKRRMETEQ